MTLQYRFADVKIDLDSFRLSKAGRVLEVEPKALNLLIFMVRNPGRLVERRELIGAVWGDSFVTDHVLNRAIGQLRKVLEDDAKVPRYIETVPTLGYRFIAQVETETPKPPAEIDPSPVNSLPPSPEPQGADEIALTPLNDSGPRLRRRTIYAGVALFLVGISAALWVSHGRAGVSAVAPIKSLAVIPLDNLSGDPGQDYYADGMTDELITMLAKNSTLRVTSRTSILQYKGAHRPLREIAQTLGVDGILEGSVARTGNQVHMTLQLIQAPTDTHLWAESYDREMKDVPGLPREVAEAIAKRLNSTVPSLPPARYVNPEAHDAYVHGRYLWISGDYEESHEYLKKATEIQPDYALGWSGLADYYGAGAASGELDPKQAFPQQEAAARKAIQLDDSLAQAHLAMAAVYFFGRWDWAAADREALRAIELDPKFAEAYYFRAMILSTLNRHQEAIESGKKSLEIDPFSRPYALAGLYNDAREYDAALKDAFQRLESTTNNIGLLGAVASAYWNKAMFKEAVDFEAQADLSEGDKESALGKRRAFQQEGAKGVVQWRLRTLNKAAAKGYVSPVGLAGVYGELGEREKALALLDEAYRQHSPNLLGIQHNPDFDFLHSEERYRTIIREMGLPPAY